MSGRAAYGRRSRHGDSSCGCDPCADCCSRRPLGWAAIGRFFVLGILWWLAGFLQLRRFIKLSGRGDDEPREGSDPREPECIPIPRDVYRRPDPMLYSQGYLMSQGLAVTWDNPDIHLERGGVAVASSELDPDTDYEIVARIWNGSNNAPAVNLPVRFSYLDFGIGTVEVAIGGTKVDLPVNGAAGHPAIARHPWKTPATPGHYCIRVEPVWADDANPANNVGQENVNVKPLNSPRAVFTFPVRNDGRTAQPLRLEIDGYLLDEPRRCDDDRPAATPDMTPDEIERHRRDALSRHARDRWGLPEGWQVTLEPLELRLEPDEQRDVTIDITAPDGFKGRQAINVNAFDPRHLVGGVTLYVDGSGS
jgi:hypothetical protein